MQYRSLNLRERIGVVLKEISENMLGNIQYREQILDAFHMLQNKEDPFFLKYNKATLLFHCFEFSKRGVIIKELTGEKGWKRVSVISKKIGEEKQIISFFDENYNPIVEFFIETTSKAFIENLMNSVTSKDVIPKDYIFTKIEVYLQGIKKFEYEEYRTFWDNKVFLEKYQSESLKLDKIDKKIWIDSPYKQFLYDMFYSATLESKLEIVYQNGYPCYAQMTDGGKLSFVGNNPNLGRKVRQVIDWTIDLSDEAIESIYQVFPQTNVKKYIRKNTDK